MSDRSIGVISELKISRPGLSRQGFDRRSLRTTSLRCGFAGLGFDMIHDNRRRDGEMIGRISAVRIVVDVFGADHLHVGAHKDIVDLRSGAFATEPVEGADVRCFRMQHAKRIAQLGRRWGIFGRFVRSIDFALEVSDG